MVLLLVNFGFYSKPDDITDLMIPLRVFINGENDRKSDAVEVFEKEQRLSHADEGSDFGVVTGALKGLGRAISKIQRTVLVSEADNV